MSIQSDRWIREQAIKNRMIEPFSETQVAEGVISYGLSSYGYDLRVSDEFKIFTNVNRAIRAGVGGFRDTRNLQHHPPASQGLRQRRAVPDSVFPLRRGLRDQLRRSQGPISETTGNRSSQALGVVAGKTG